MQSKWNWNLEGLVFDWSGKPESLVKTCRRKERANNKLNPQMALTPGFEPGQHWWEKSALTTAPPLLPRPWHKVGVTLTHSVFAPRHLKKQNWANVICASLLSSLKITVLKRKRKAKHRGLIMAWGSHSAVWLDYNALSSAEVSTQKFRGFATPKHYAPGPSCSKAD